MFGYKRILVPLDGSTLAEQALAPAGTLAKLMDAQLLLIRVVSPFLREVDEHYTQQVIEWSRAEAIQYLESVQQRLMATSRAIRIKTVIGPVAESILQYAQENSVDLIVMSSHGRSGISRWVFGSVTEKVLRGAHCAVLVVRDSENQSRSETGITQSPAQT